MYIVICYQLWWKFLSGSPPTTRLVNKVARVCVLRLGQKIAKGNFTFLYTASCIELQYFRQANSLATCRRKHQLLRKLPLLLNWLLVTCWATSLWSWLHADVTQLDSSSTTFFLFTIFTTASFNSTEHWRSAAQQADFVVCRYDRLVLSVCQNNNSRLCSLQDRPIPNWPTAHRNGIAVD